MPSFDIFCSRIFIAFSRLSRTSTSRGLPNKFSTPFLLQFGKARLSYMSAPGRSRSLRRRAAHEGDGVYVLDRKFTNRPKFPLDMGIPWVVAESTPNGRRGSVRAESNGFTRRSLRKE